MINRFALLFFTLFAGILTGYSQTNLTTFVDPFIGTENGGNVFLGAAVPFGMVKLGPDCGNNDNNSGYYRDQNINGFSHTHVTGTGGGAKYGNILLMPESGDLQISQISSARTDEVAGAGYYSAFLSRYKIKAELIATASVGFQLGQNYPNPFNGKTNISFEIPNSTYVFLKVYNMFGTEIIELSEKEYSTGIHTVEFDTKSLAKGIYIYTIKADKFSASQKMIVQGE